MITSISYGDIESKDHCYVIFWSILSKLRDSKPTNNHSMSSRVLSQSNKIQQPSRPKNITMPMVIKSLLSHKLLEVYLNWYHNTQDWCLNSLRNKFIGKTVLQNLILICRMYSPESTVCIRIFWWQLKNKIQNLNVKRPNIPSIRFT